MHAKFFDKLGKRPSEKSEIKIEVINNLEQLYSVRKEWLAFEETLQDPLSYFQCYDWCEKWSRIYGPDAFKNGGSLNIAIIRKGGALAAILPLAIENRMKLVRVLRFIGEPMIQYAKILLDANLLSEDELQECIARIYKLADCDVVYLDHMVEGSPLHKSLDNADCYKSNQGHASAIVLDGFKDGDAYRASLSRQTRKSRNRKRRKLKELGELEYCIVDGHDPSFQKLCEIALEQKRIWLENTGKPSGKITDNRMKRMLGELGGDNGTKSGAIAFALVLNKKPIALEIGFWRSRHYYSFLGSYDWSMASYSPGKLLLEDAITWCIDRNIGVYDLLGNPTEYKDALANHKIPLVAYAHGKTIAGGAYARYWRPSVKPSIKQLLVKMPTSIRQLVFSSLSIGKTGSL